MRERMKSLLIVIGAFGCLALLAGCALIQPAGALTLNVGYSEESSSVQLSITDGPEQGLSGIFIEASALRFDPSVIRLSSVHGSNDFAVLSHSFDNRNGEASIVAVKAVGGIRNGVIATLTFVRIDDGNPGISVDPGGVHLLDAADAPIESFCVLSN